MKQIKLSTIAKIQRLYIKQFTELDQDRPDYRVVYMYDRNIGKYLRSITEDVKEQEIIYEAITTGSWDTRNLSYKPICDKIRNLGYEVVEKW